ncbi:MAG: HAD-IA family hydrolase [Burkholderiaceae bacterium]
MRKSSPASETVAQLRARGLRIGSTTGYTRAIMAPVHELAESQGLAVDDIVCADDVPVGRPSPLMIYRAMISLAVWPAASVVKVDDTAAGIAEGLAAGCWTIGVVMTGNEVGLSADSLAAMAPAERDALRERGRDALLRAGAHRVVDSVAGLGPVIDELDARLGDGETPGKRRSAHRSSLNARRGSSWVPRATEVGDGCVVDAWQRPGLPCYPHLRSH